MYPGSFGGDIEKLVSSEFICYRGRVTLNNFPNFQKLRGKQRHQKNLETAGGNNVQMLVKK